MVIKDLLNQIINRGIITEADHIVLGLSGGPDSVCLFHVLAEIKKYINMTFSCVHVNHGLRGGESNDDENFVINLCKTEDIPLTVIKVDCNKLAKDWKMTTEEAGRKVRYEAFRDEVNRIDSEYKTGNCKTVTLNIKIAVAQNKDDQAETILFRLIRGTGISGIKSMSQKSEILIDGKSYMIIRPLLGFSKQDILDSLNFAKIEYCIDKTNLKPVYTRNKIRLELIPLMELINPEVKNALVRTGEIAKETDDFIISEARNVLEDVLIYKNQNKMILSSACLAQKHKVIQKAVFSIALKEIGLVENVSYSHFDSLVNLLTTKDPSSEVNLPKEYLACRMYENVAIFSPKYLENKDRPWSISDEGKLIRIIFSKKKIEERFGSGMKPILRQRLPGDYMMISEDSRKKIKKIFVDDKVPRIFRNHVPVLAIGSQILWIGDVSGRTNGRVAYGFNQGDLIGKEDETQSDKDLISIEILM
ncbi:tRNA lysidine(34) synthetase TilS [Eubacteriales bacterium KG127]